MIVADTPKTEAILKDICTCVQDHGGFIHPDLLISCKQGDVSILFSGSPKQEFLLKIPHDLMLLYDDFCFEIQDRQIAIHSHVENISEVRLELMKLMLSLYNDTNKLQSHIETSPWHIYRQDPDIMNMLLNAREGGDVNMLRHFWEKKDWENFTLHSFFKCRLLNCNVNDKHEEAERVLMPIVDFMNHDIKGVEYQNFYTPEGGILAIPPSKIEQESAEHSEYCVKYGTFDRLDSYLHYSFVDQSSSFVRSVPLEIDLGKYGTIRIRSLNAYVAPKMIPEGFKDLSFYMPIIKKNAVSRHVAMSHAIIPGYSAPKALRRILSLTIQMLNPGLNKDKIYELMLESERGILDFNMDFYTNLQNKLELSDCNKNEKSEMMKLAKTQVEHLENYKNMQSD